MRLKHCSTTIPDSTIQRRSENPSSSNSRIETASPLYYTQATSNNTNKYQIFNNYLKSFAKTNNSSFSPLVKVKIPKNNKKICGNKAKSKRTAYVAPSQKHVIAKRKRPARFLSQEDLENHIKTNKDKNVRIIGNEEDMKILMENNHTQILKSLEDDKICRLYHTYIKKPGIIKNTEWTWESPQTSPRNVKFKDQN